MTDQDYMQNALDLAQQAEQHGEVPVGALVIYQGQIIGQGYNQPIAQHDASAHAEIIALRQAGQHLQNYRLCDCTLYVTLEPCMMCLGAMIHARIGRIVYGASDPKTGVLGSTTALHNQAFLNHYPKITANVLSEPCGQLLRNFFKKRRT